MMTVSGPPEIHNHLLEEIDFSAEQESILSLLAQPSPEDSSPPIVISVKEVCQEFKRLKVNKAPGTNRVLSHLRSVLTRDVMCFMHFSLCRCPLLIFLPLG